MRPSARGRTLNAAVRIVQAVRTPCPVRDKALETLRCAGLQPIAPPRPDRHARLSCGKLGAIWQGREAQPKYAGKRVWAWDSRNEVAPTKVETGPWAPAVPIDAPYLRERWDENHDYRTQFRYRPHGNEDIVH
jgi:hypothetical protein